MLAPPVPRSSSAVVPASIASIPVLAKTAFPHAMEINEIIQQPKVPSQAGGAGVTNDNVEMGDSTQPSAMHEPVDDSRDVSMELGSDNPSAPSSAGVREGANSVMDGF